MAKTENPAEVLERAQPSRPAQRVLSEPAPRVESRSAASPTVAARRSLLQDAADTLVGRHHDLDAMDARDGERLAADLLAADLLDGDRLDSDRLEGDRLEGDRPAGDLLEEDGNAGDPRDASDHGEPGRIFRPHAGQYDRSHDDRSHGERAGAWSQRDSSEAQREPGVAQDSRGADHADRAVGGRRRAYLRREDYLRAEDLEAALLDDEDVLDELEQAARTASAEYVSPAEHSPTEHPAAYEAGADEAGAYESGSYEAAAYEAAAYEAAAYEASGSESPTFGLPRVGSVRAGGRGAPKVPLATLEQPSSSRLELTPSPVPRVSLTPATGAVDISLVPGPNGSRNLPTLAAQHVLGRRQPRRPAAAVTLPPPNTTARESRVGTELASNVRSSKREVVLGLMIGLALSVVLAGVGQSYLRDPMIADGTSASAELESVTLSARPDAPADPASAGAAGASVAGASVAGASPADPFAGGHGATPSPGSAVSPAAVARTSGTDGTPAAPAHPARQAAPFAVAVNDDSEAALFAQARAPSRGALARATRAPERATRGLGTRPRKSSPIATDPPSSEPARAPGAERSSDGKASDGAGKAFESSSAPAPRTPLSPAESAGLGLDLPL